MIAIATIAICSCGEDRSSEFYELTKENQWIHSKMKEVYLWSDSIKEISQKDYFAKPTEFFSKLLYSTDKTSYFTDSVKTERYGFSFSLLRDPLGLEPSKAYALVEYVEPASVAANAGLERGMWITAINGTDINMGSGDKLTEGPATLLDVRSIIYDDDNEQYLWSEPISVEMQAATEIKISSLPVSCIISDISGKTGYILCNSFDDENSVADIYNVLSHFSAEGVSNIVVDLRYNKSFSLANTASVAASFVPADKQGSIFCSLQKKADSASKEDLLFPHATVNVSNIQLYIITTAKTEGTANALIRALRLVRGTSTLKVVGETATGTDIATESIESPYQFKINPATAIIKDANGESLKPTTPDYSIKEIGDYKHIYPLGNKQEYMLYNISYIIANGTLPTSF